MMELIFSVQELPDVAEKILAFGADCKIFAFEGELGTGKTTLIKEICKRLGVEQEVSSPTYSIINEYFNRKGEAVYHFDFYRLKSSKEVADIGSEDYFYSGSYCFIEWPEMAEQLLPETFIKLELNLEGSNRKLNLTKVYPDGRK